MRGSQYCIDPETAIAINRRLVGNTANIRDLRALESALAAPLCSFAGELLIPSPIERTATLLHGIIKAHAFVDGNKRTAWICAVAYLEQEGFMLAHVSDADVVSFVEGVARSTGQVDRVYLSRWIVQRLD